MNFPSDTAPIPGHPPTKAPPLLLLRLNKPPQQILLLENLPFEEVRRAMVGQMVTLITEGTPDTLAEIYDIQPDPDAGTATLLLLRLKKDEDNPNLIDTTDDTHLVGGTGGDDLDDGATGD